MNTLEILDACSGNSKTSKNFKGVFPSDCLPKKIKKSNSDSFVIANTHDKTKSGEHWVGFYFPKNSTKGEYFDSFGQKPVNKSFIKFLKRNSKSFKYNKQQLQSDFSTTCGQWCCLYMYYRCTGKTLKQFLKMFSKKNFSFNDKKVIYLYQKYYGAPQLHHIQKGGKKILYNQCCTSRKKC